VSVAGGRATRVSRVIGLTGLPRYVRGGTLVPRREGFCVKSASGGCTVHWQTTANHPARWKHGFERLLLVVPELISQGFTVEVVQQRMGDRVARGGGYGSSHVDSHLFVSRAEWTQDEEEGNR
jgi:hypothetical protein